MHLLIQTVCKLNVEARLGPCLVGGALLRVFSVYTIQIIHVIITYMDKSDMTTYPMRMDGATT